MALYENVYIGTFIYLLGIEVGKRGLENNSSVNLFQQTPVDATLNDLITGVNGKFLIIEFKRIQNKDNKEKEKATKLIKKLDKDSSLSTISEQCHYLCIGNENSDNIFDFYEYAKYFQDREDILIEDFISKYIDVRVDNPHDSVHQDVYIFAESLPQFGVEHKDFLTYLQLLKDIYNESGVEGSSGGIILSNDNGNIGMLPTDNIQELVLKLEQRIEQQNVHNPRPTFGGPKM
jgi:hypothetical protein